MKDKGEKACDHAYGKKGNGTANCISLSGNEK